MGLSALDFPFCFLAVRALGTERIGQWEHAIVTTVKEAVGKVLPLSKEVEGTVKEGEAQLKETMGMRKKVTEKEGEEEWSWGVEEAQVEASKDNASMLFLVLPFTLHVVASFLDFNVKETKEEYPGVLRKKDYVSLTRYSSFSQHYGPNSSSPTRYTNPSSSSAYH